MQRDELERLSKAELIDLVLRLQRPEKTSRTSSKPPSTDRKERRERSRPGGAKPGHEGRSPRARYKVGNWPEYDKALQQRGSLTVWVTPEALAAWHPPKTGRRGRSPQYAELAIETGHLL